jgi:hypothetical protein
MKETFVDWRLTEINIKIVIGDSLRYFASLSTQTVGRQVKSQTGTGLVSEKFSLKTKHH